MWWVLFSYLDEKMIKLVFHGSIGLSVAGIISSRSIPRLCGCHGSLGLSVAGIVSHRSCILKPSECHFSIGLFVRGWHCQP